MYIVVSQFFATEAENEYVIRANSAIMKCKIPSFVSEFVYVDQWVANDGTIYRPGEQEYGTRARCDAQLGNNNIITEIIREPESRG